MKTWTNPMIEELDVKLTAKKALAKRSDPIYGKIKVSQFIESFPGYGKAKAEKLATKLKKGKGFVVNRNPGYEFSHLAYTFKDKKAEPFLVTIEPNGNPPVMDEHEGQEFDYVLSGQMMLYIGDICYELSEGDSAYFNSTIPHAHKVIGESPAQFIALVLK